MNKIFKVVWSKTKECYVVVSEVAKNNSGKKKVLASVLAALAVVGVGAGNVGAYNAGGGHDGGSNTVAIGNNAWAQTSGAVAIGNGTNANGSAPGANSVAIGYESNANGDGSVSIGKSNTTKNIRAVAIGEQNTAQDADTIAMGYKNTAKTGGIAIGSNNTTDSTENGGRANNNGQIAIGQDNKATNEDTIAIGRGTTASARLATAIGRNADAIGVGSIAFGSNGEPDSHGVAYRTISKGLGAVAIGMGAGADGRAVVALGGMSKAEADGATAISYGAKSLSKKSVAIGQDSLVNKQNTTSSYEFSGSHGTPSPAGYNTETITINSGSAPASGAVAGNYYDAGSAVAIGNGATVSSESDRAVVVGPDAKTNGNAHYSVVLGSGSHADASDGFVGGHGSYVESRESIAMGSGANVRGNENIRSQAIGYGATVSGTGAYDATAIGATAQVSGVQGGVALGAGSLLSRTTNSNENAGWNSKRLNGTVIRNRAYTATVDALGTQWDAGAQIGAVSVGNDNQQRQIINVAAGNKDTDAVNVAQLKNVGVRVGADTNTATITVGTNTSKVAADFLAYNGQLNIKGDNNRVTTVSENDANGKDANVNVKFDYDGLVKAKTGSAVTVDQKTDAAGKTYFEIDAAAASKTVLADGKNTTVTGAGTTASPYKVNVEGALTGISSITNNTGGKIEFTTSGTTISGGPVNVSNNKITGVADGDVSSTSKDAVNGSQLHAVKTAERHIAPTTAGTEYTVDSNGDVTMTYLDGNNNAVANEKAVIKGIAKQDLTNINDAGKKVITGLGTIVKAGDNVNVSESSDATTGQKTYTVNAVTPAVYTKADGTKVYKRPDGTFTTNQNLAAGNNVDKGDVITSFMDGNGNTTGGNMVINNVGSAIDKTGTSTGSTFLTKLDTAATNTPNAAVNVKDLKNTSDALINKGLNFTGNNDATVNAHKLGSLVKVQGEGVAATDVPGFASAAGNIAVVANGTDTLELKLNKNLKGINSVSNGSSSITLNSNPGGTNNTPAVQITGGNLSMGNGTTNNKIVNLAPGTNDTDAVNYSQIKGLRTEVKQGANVTVSKTQGTDGHDIYTISAAATGGTASSWNIKSSADTANGGATATGHNANAVNISDQKTVEMVAGKNLTVKQDTTTDGAKVEFALSDNIVAGKDGVNGKDGSVGATGKDGSSVVINGADGSIGMTGPKGQDGKDGINGRDGANISMTSAKGEQVLVNRDPAHNADTDKAERIVYVPKDANGDPIKGADGKNIVREVATMDDGLKFAGDDAQGTDKSKVIAKKLNNTVDIIGGADKDKLTNNNIGVNNDNGKLKVQLAKTIDLTKDGSVTTGNTKVDNSGVTITAPTGSATTNVTLTQSGLDNGGNKITNVKAGTDNTDAVNVKQLKDTEKHIKPGSYAVQSDGSVTLNYQDGNNNDLTETAKITGIAKQDLSNIDNAGKKVITGLGSIVEAGDNVTVTSTENATTGQKTYTVNAVTPAVYTTPSGEKLTKKSDGKFYKADGSEYTGGDIIASFENPNANSIPAGKNSTTDGGMIVNNIGSAIKNQTPTMPAGQTATYLDKLKAAADAGSNVKNAAVNVSDLHNTAEALKSNELHIRPTVTNRTGETVNQNAGGTAESYKYDSTTKSVTLKYNDGTGAGVTGTEAKIDLSDLANQITSGYTFKTNATENGGKVVNDVATPAAETAVANGGVVNYAAGKNLTVKQDIEKDGTGAATGKQTYTYALSDEIGIGEKGQPGVAGKDGVDGKIGVNGKDGSSVVINGKDGSIGMTGPKGQDGKDGINGRDGANISMTSAKGEQVLVNRDPAHNADNDKAERIVYVPKDASGNPIQDANGKNIVREVATMDDGLKFTGNNESTVNNNKLNTLVKVQGEGTKEDTNAAGAKEIQTSDGTKFESAKDNIAVVADGTNTLTVKLNKKLKGLDSVQTKTVELGDHTTPGGTTNITYNTGNNRIEYTIPGTTDTKKVATTDDIWTIQGNGTDVAPVNGKVNVKAGENILITTPATADGSMTINAVTPAVYTDKDGNKLTKDKDGKFHKDDGTEVAAADVITSIQDAAGNTTGGHSIVNNVGSAINNHATPGVTSPTYLDKLDAAAGDTKTQNAAVNVTDLKNTADGLTDKGLNFTGNNESTVNKHKLGSLVKVQGEGTKEGTNAAGTKEIQTSDGTKFESAKDNIAVEANNGDTLTVKLNKNLKGLDSVQTKTVVLGNPDVANGTTNITYNPTDKRIEYVTPDAAGTGTTTNKVANLADEKHIKEGTYAVANDGSVTLNYQDGNKNDLTETAKITGIAKQDLSNIDNAGKTVITGLGTIVKAGDNVTVTSTSDGTTGQKTYTVNAVTPAIYTDKNGNKVVKRADGTYTTNLDGSAGNDVAANDVIVSFKDAAGNTTGGNSIINNVGSAIKNQTPTMPTGVTATYLDKLKAAADDTKTQNAAVNVSDLHNTANALKDSELHIAPTAVKSGSTEVKGGVASGNSNPGAAAQAYKYNATTKQVELTFNDGNGNAVADTKAVIDLSNLPTGGDMSSFHVTSSAESTTVGTHAGDTTQEIKDGKSIDFQAGKNMTVTQTNNSGNTVINYALDKNLDVESVHVGKDGKDGKIGIDGKDGVDGLNGTNRVDIHVEKGAKGVDGTDGHDGVNGHNGKDGMTRIVYEDKGGKQEVATLNDGLKFTGNNESTVNNNKLNTLVKVQGEGTKEGTNAAGAKEIQTSDGTKFESAKDNIAVVADGTDTLTVKLNKNLKGLESVSVPGKDGVDGRDGVSITGKDGANGIDGKVGIGKDGKDAVSISGKDGIGHIGLTGSAGKDGKNATADITVKEGKAGVDGKDGITRIVYNDKDGNEHQVATHDDGLKFTGNNVSTENKHKLNSVVKVQGEGVTENATSGKLEVNGQEFKSAAGNIAVVADGDKTLTVKMNKDLNLTKDGSLTIGDTKVNNDGITITGGPSVTKTGINAGNKAITNVANGTNNSDAVNVSQLKGSITTVQSSDGSISVTDANAGSADPTKGHAYDIKINNQRVVEKAQTPVVYTDKDGNKLYKIVDPTGHVTFNTKEDGSGITVQPAEVIASMNNGSDSTNNPMKLNNVGSSIEDHDTPGNANPTFLDKLDAAAGDNKTKHGAVNVSDLKNTADAIGEKGLNFGAQSGTDIHKNLGEKLEIVGGGTKVDDKYDASNIKTMTKDGKVVIALDKDLKADSVTVGEKGQPGVPGKDGVDGKIGVNGKDGSAVVINGKDGSIGLNGKDGANGITIKGDKGVDGVDGVNGTNGITRIVYQDKDGNNHEVATHDDGMKFAGDDGQTNQDTNPQVIKKHLNKVVDIVGGADKTKLTDNNIGVNNDGGKLRVQLANELSGITKISNGGSSISIADVPAGATSPAVTISGGNLSMGDGTHNNKIVNLAAGTNDTDAVNYKQLKDSRTTVTSQDGSVTITPTPNGDSMNYDLKVNPPLDPRVDQLAEEVGRVGAQGAALSALKPIQYDPLEPTQIMAGYGNYRGNSAIAMGVAHYKNESTLIHGGISWAGGSSHMMANAGVTWKVGNRDSEAAVADRYRKGPISSAYAMQQEMAAMKAQNAGLKGEVSDLKAENEQMKAQISAMMAKLGL